ncbi:hypothetical protein OQA88_662 [Cercophora sp. LCS_1]
MSNRDPFQWVDALVTTLLLFLSFDQCNALSNTSYEIDIISPTAGGRYRVNLDRGIGVVVAVQNKHAAERFGWNFSWQVRSHANRTESEGRSVYFSLGGFGSKDTIDAHHVIQNDDDVYIGLTHDYLYTGSNLPDDAIPPGDYTFSWRVQTGPTCWDDERSRGYNAIGDTFGGGSFNFSVVDDAPWPNLKPSPCASAAGLVSFAPTAGEIVSWVVPTTTPLACGTLQSVTETANPCRVTVGPEQAKRISSIMTWVERAPPVTRTGTESSTSSPTGTSASRAGSSSSWVRPCYTTMAVLLVSVQWLQVVV